MKKLEEMKDRIEVQIEQRLPVGSWFTIMAIGRFIRIPTFPRSVFTTEGGIHPSKFEEGTYFNAVNLETGAIEVFDIYEAASYRLDRIDKI